MIVLSGIIIGPLLTCTWPPDVALRPSILVLQGVGRGGAVAPDDVAYQQNQAQQTNTNKLQLSPVKHFKYLFVVFAHQWGKLRQEGQMASRCSLRQGEVPAI